MEQGCAVGDEAGRTHMFAKTEFLHEEVKAVIERTVAKPYCLEVCSPIGRDS
jgi:hypothetical protein